MARPWHSNVISISKIRGRNVADFGFVCQLYVVNIHKISVLKYPMIKVYWIFVGINFG